MSLPKPIEHLIGELSKLPGVGRRSAERMTFDLVAAPPDRIKFLVEALTRVSTGVSSCPVCGYFAIDGACGIHCSEQNPGTLVIVEKALDVIAIEKAGGYRGGYHVLGGHLSPLKGIGPDDLRLAELFDRLKNPDLKELILATSPTVEGDATAMYIAAHVNREDLTVTRLGRGVPMGGSLEYADSGTLRLAIESRRALDAK